MKTFREVNEGLNQEQRILDIYQTLVIDLKAKRKRHVILVSSKQAAALQDLMKHDSAFRLYAEGKSDDDEKEIYWSFMDDKTIVSILENGDHWNIAVSFNGIWFKPEHGYKVY